METRVGVESDRISIKAVIVVYYTRLAVGFYMTHNTIVDMFWDNGTVFKSNCVDALLHGGSRVCEVETELYDSGCVRGSLSEWLSSMMEYGVVLLRGRFYVVRRALQHTTVVRVIHLLRGLRGVHRERVEMESDADRHEYEISLLFVRSVKVEVEGGRWGWGSEGQIRGGESDSISSAVGVFGVQGCG
ncbi:hypothetical protein Tco_1403814 [Tanacetum coccineum]